MSFDHFIFDVGGVLRDSSLAISIGFQKGFEQAGIPFNFTKDDIWHLRGFGKYQNSTKCIVGLLCLEQAREELGQLLLQDDCESLMGLIVQTHSKSINNTKIEIIHKTYKEYFYSKDARSKILLYPKVQESLDLLCSRGKNLYIFTNTSQKATVDDLNEIDTKMFRKIIGAEDGTCKKKPSGEGIALILNEFNLDSKKTVYIGDSSVDVLAAHDAGISIAVLLQGMGLKYDLVKYKPEYIFDNIEEAVNFLS
jgi:HAD superfamily hydrolase (TIGR01549 family)